MTSLETHESNGQLYLALLKSALTDALHEENDLILGGTSRGSGSWKMRLAHRVGAITARRGVELVYKRRYDPELRQNGRDWPSRADSMIGIRRMDNLQGCVEDVLAKDVPGDLIETGVWRGGASILMRAVLKSHGVTDRKVWCADSFEGLPRPDRIRYGADVNDIHFKFEGLRVGVEQVRHNFERYGLLDDQVEFLVGWFEATLPDAPIDKLAVLRLDGDMYSSTIQALDALYAKLQPGGYCIVDDYGAVPACRQAVEDFRTQHGITELIQDIDGYGAYWQKD
jgi:O-methyltransferase